jgi:type III pantothenate kinase
MKRMKKNAPEFLLIDIGNTRLKWATASYHSPIRLRGDVATKEVTSLWVHALAQKFPDRPVVLASVVLKLLPAFRNAFAKRLIEVRSTLPELGIRFHYPKPAEIGADRLAAATAVHADDRYPTIIVACGTATAFTVLDEKGRFCGGAIAAGLQAQLDSLLAVTAQLPATKLYRPRSALARSTKEAIRAGVMVSFQGGVKEIIQQLSKSLAGRKKPRIILTGGNALYLSKSLGHPHTLRPLLVFEGLRIIGNRVWNAHHK